MSSSRQGEQSMRVVLKTVLLICACALVSGCGSDKAHRCANVYAGTIGLDECRTSTDKLNGDGEFIKLDTHCRLWLIYNGRTGRCKGWHDPDAPRWDPARRTKVE